MLRRYLRMSLGAIAPLALPVGLTAAALPALGLGPGLEGGRRAGETRTAHHLRTCRGCSEDGGDARMTSHLSCPGLAALAEAIAGGGRPRREGWDASESASLRGQTTPTYEPPCMISRDRG